MAARAWSTRDIYEKRYELIEFEGGWKEAFGQPSRGIVIFIYAPSTSGKSDFVMQLAKELTKFGNVLYDSLEEGDAHTFQERMKRHGMHDCGSRFKVVEESKEDLCKRLDKQRSPEFVIIDSVAYLQVKWQDYLAMVRKYVKKRGKTLVIVGHAQGKEPYSELEKRISFDATQKIYVEGFKAKSKGRYIGSTGEFTIWEKGANEYWGENK